MKTEETSINNLKDYSCKIAVKFPTIEAFKAISKVSKWWVIDLEGNTKNLNDILLYTSEKPLFRLK